MSNKLSDRKHPLLDTLLKEFNEPNDAHLARAIGVRASQICKYRAGTPISDSTRIKILRKTSWTINKLDAIEAEK